MFLLPGRTARAGTQQLYARSSEPGHQGGLDKPARCKPAPRRGHCSKGPPDVGSLAPARRPHSRSLVTVSAWPCVLKKCPLLGPAAQDLAHGTGQ